MLRRMRELHRRELRSRWLIDVASIERPQPDGTVAVLGPYPAEVQTLVTFSGQMPADVSDVNERQRRIRWLFMDRDVVVLPADRVLWNGGRYETLIINEPGTAEPYIRVLIGREGIGTAPEAVTFYRRRNGVTETVGTFVVHRTEGVPLPTENTGSAVGKVIDGTFVGGADLNEVVVGDWFDLHGLPGQVLGKDTSSLDAVELRYQRQVVAP